MTPTQARDDADGASPGVPATSAYGSSSAGDSAGNEDPVAGLTAESPAESSAEQGGPFGGLSPSEAARRKHRLEREGRRQQAHGGETVSESYRKALEKRARKGDIEAHNELERLGSLDQGWTLSREAMDALTHEEREVVRVTLEGAHKRITKRKDAPTVEG